MATVANSKICTVAPAAYHKGPDTPAHCQLESGPGLQLCCWQRVPYRKATLLDCSKVAAQVQDETTALATRPDLTVRPAVENISEVCSSLLYRLSTHVVKTFSIRQSCNLYTFGVFCIPCLAQTRIQYQVQCHSPRPGPKATLKNL